MKVRNRRTIRHLSWKILLANNTRNKIAVIAIVLTAMMFSALFTIAVTLNYSSQQQTMRQVGGYSHGGFKRLTWEQVQELESDSLIRESGATFLFGSPTQAPFDKIWAEIRYAQDNYARFCWSLPTVGRMPAAQKEIALDTAILEALGIPARLGQEVTLTFPQGEESVTDTFTLCGYWEADPALPAHMIWIDREYALSRMAQVPDQIRKMKGVGQWYLDLVFFDSRDIEGKLEEIAEKHGYRVGEKTQGEELSVGINWAYTSTRTENMDLQSVALLTAALLVMMLSGYLIIYNVFQISVTGDIRFYGLLKTIGTTGRQIRRIVFYQALFLSAVGIPVGLLLGYGAGNLLLPTIMSILSDQTLYHSGNPLIFAGSGLFTLLTVFISCFVPARQASKVSPVEAVRYTEAGSRRKRKKRIRKGNRVIGMAWANLMRNKRKTALVVLSLSLSIVMLNSVYAFTGGFNIEGFLKKFSVSDFLVGDADYFRYQGWEDVSRTLVEEMKNREGFEDGGYVQIYNSYSQARITKEKWLYYMRELQKMKEDDIDPQVLQMPDDAPMDMGDELYVLDDYTIGKMEVLEGSLDRWEEPGSIVQLVTYDDYNKPDMSKKVFDVGESFVQVYSDDYTVSEDGTEVILKSKEEVSYTVIATAAIPGIMTNRRYGNPKFALSEKAIPESVQKNLTKMIFMADYDEEGAAQTEKFIRDYTEKTEPEMAYESRGKLGGYYRQFQSIIWMVGGTLSFIIGLVGVLNFINGEITGIMSRRREMAVLQSIGMTGRQMKKMLILEGILTIIMALLLAVILNLGVYYGLMPAVEKLFWYFKRNAAAAMIFASAPVLVLLGIGIPIMVYHKMSEKSVVERLREWDL